MVSALSLLCSLALVPWTSALLLATPVDWHSSSQVNVSWSHTSTDPTFSLQLFNTNEFHDTFAIANNLDPTKDFASFQLGVIPVGQYTLRAINVTNAGQIYDETPPFAIAAAPSTTSSVASSTSASGTSSGAASGTTGSATVTVPPGSSTGGFGTTVSNSGSTAAGSNTGTSTSASDTAVPSNFNGGGNNGAASLPRLAPWALAALGVVAGGAAVAL